MSLDDLADEAADEAVPLIAEDIQAARAQLGITAFQAAKRARIGNARYRALEEGSIPRTQHNMRSLISVAGRLGLKSVRLSYSDEAQMYLKLDLSASFLTLFVDVVETDVREMKELQYFVRPAVVFAFVQRIGLRTVFESRGLAHIAELWVVALFALSLSSDLDHYVRLVRDDPPDAEILTVHPKTGAFTTLNVEVTCHEKHSPGLFKIIAKKLRNRYQSGTIILVLVAQSERLSPNEVYSFIKSNNPYNQNIVIIGANADSNGFKVLPFDTHRLSMYGNVENTGWAEIEVDEKAASKGNLPYVAISFERRGSGRLRGALAQFPVFMKKITLSR